MDKNEIELSIEVTKLLRIIIRKQNLDLIKQISRDYNRNENILLSKYYKGVYN